MKKMVIIFLILIIAFIGLWTLKLNAPITPNNDYTITEDTPWWLSSNGEAPTPDEDWILDHEIPANYIPVLGRDELYMVIDDNGNIIKYRQRTQQEDGSWIWEDIDPNIPQNYEPVPGLENVYKTTDVDGTVHYYRYTRNADDTYFFTEVDKNGNPLKDDTPVNDEIPPNFIRVDGTNIYAIYNEYGVLIGYKERIQNKDGSYSWIDAKPPTQSNNSKPVNISSGQGAIPGLDTNISGNSNITVISDPDTVNRGYTEQETYTDTVHKNGWIIVYETIVTRKYNESGDLVSTSKEGPTEINRFPETEINSNLIPE